VYCLINRHKRAAPYFLNAVLMYNILHYTRFANVKHKKKQPIIVGGDGVEFLRLICSDSTLTFEATLDTNAAGRRAQSKTLTQSVDYFVVWGTYSCDRAENASEQSSTNSFHSRSQRKRDAKSSASAD
jgi:hypothetical protein